MFKPNEIERFSMLLDPQMKALEIQIMSDIIRRIRINGEITSSADWQLHRLYELGMSKRDIQNALRKHLNLSASEIRQLYSDVIQKGYARDISLYQAAGKKFIPFEKNHGLQQLISAVASQTQETMLNITQSLGFAVRQTNGKLAFRPIADYYQQTLDSAMLQITSGTFDYNTVLKRTVSEMTNSGLRTVDYTTGWSNRIEVAARRSVMTGLSQVTAKVNEDNAEALETEFFEVTWHGGARPEHQVWQGRVYSKDDLEKVCGLGDVTGLCGANCYHDYFPFIPGISERSYSDEEIAELNQKETIPLEYNGKKYTKYEALQRQRKLETTMRAQRQQIHLLKVGNASQDDLINARARYRVTSHQYSLFSQKMGLPQQRERVTIDGLGNIGQGKYTGGSGKLSPVRVPKPGAHVSDTVAKAERTELLRHPADVLPQNSLTNPVGSGIITLKDNSEEWRPVTENSISSVPKITEFSSRALNETVGLKCKEILQDLLHDELGTEATVSISLEDFTSQKQKGGQGEGGVKFISMNKPYISIHNHPSCETFSIRDLEALYDDSHCHGLIVVGNNGNMYIMKKETDFDSMGFFEHIMKKKYGFSEFDSDYDFMKGAEKYGVRYYERTN